jgi:hypothetical protein
VSLVNPGLRKRTLTRRTLQRCACPVHFSSYIAVHEGIRWLWLGECSNTNGKQQAAQSIDAANLRQ